jgi:hypothetical protein
MPTPQIIISDWKPRHSGTLRGFCTAHLPSGITMHEVGIHTRNGLWWAAPPSKPMVGKDGVALRGDDGRIRYSPLIAFESRQLRDRFSLAVIDALRRAHPGVFAEEVVP